MASLVELDEFLRQVPSLVCAIDECCPAKDTFFFGQMKMVVDGLVLCVILREKERVMGGNNRQRKSLSSFSMFNIFKSRRSQDRDDTCDEAVKVRKVRPSDDDKVRWVAERDIDSKASAFIANFYKNRVSDPERQTVAV
ncbi:hypothetical protein HHK36_020973 [Tetracentron sinense]|uniref:Uncharacterized protein n=1 Tax=Tetracentron sinense TaxID=13715 RepID=A0A835D9B5_TETSI|nr:hypothetical protein HHK36_020973 [Tetracentron sinense]